MAIEKPTRHQALYKELVLFIEYCTTNSKSLPNYTNFNRINVCLKEILESDVDVSVYDFTDPLEFAAIVKKLNAYPKFKEFDKKGKNQYSNTLQNYLNFLFARKFAAVIKDVDSNPKESDNDLRLQVIFYGAPGTGKSNTIKRTVDDQGKICFCTTFHPDSDYSTFVGAYKPSMDKSKGQTKKAILDYEGMVDKFKEYIEATSNNITQASVLFGHDYHDSIVNMLENTSHKIPDLVTEAYKSGTTYDTNVRAGMRVYEDHPQANTKQIVYQFVPQAFTKAYTAAWNTEEDVYLIIEEINRGNCAQIFGDLFQLLDRKDGVSEYPIDADSDLADHIMGALKDSPRTDIPEEVKNGNKLMLPKNLYIWATMNTSDQSLFPMTQPSSVAGTGLTSPSRSMMRVTE